jgi:hypothetical protein
MAFGKKKIEDTIIELPKLNIQEMRVTLVGDSPLISHAWSHKAKQQMLDKQMKRAKQAKEAKSPENDYAESMYKHPDGGYGFPTIAFKAAAVAACSHVDGITKVTARGAFHIPGELVKIIGEPSMREDMVRLQTGVADIRYRGEFKEWKVQLHLRYNANVISPEQIVNLLNTAGFAVGVGEWRPASKNGGSGQYGMFHVASQKEAA